MREEEAPTREDQCGQLATLVLGAEASQLRVRLLHVLVCPHTCPPLIEQVLGQW